jgi:hypothetical protein
MVEDSRIALKFQKTHRPRTESVTTTLKAMSPGNPPRDWKREIPWAVRLRGEAAVEAACWAGQWPGE